MKLRKASNIIKVSLSILLLVGIIIAAGWVSTATAPETTVVVETKPADLGDLDPADKIAIAQLAASSTAPSWHDRANCPHCAKVAAGKGVDCTPPLSGSGRGNLEPERKIGADAQYRQVTVSSLVQRALTDQSAMLQFKVAELQRWNARDRNVFAKWFGTSSDEARRLIYVRVLRVLELNKNYTVQNFRRAHHKDGVYAYVYPTQPSKVYLDDMFLGQAPVGENSRAGTITHEMSHFSIIGGTKDHTYGPASCRDLARKNALLAITNADNFEYWAEEVR